MSATENPAAGLSDTLRDALMAAQQDGTTLYRGKRDLRYGYVTAASLLALSNRGLIQLVRVKVDIYSRSGLYYKGQRLQLDHGKLTERGAAVRTWLLAQAADAASL